MYTNPNQIVIGDNNNNIGYNAGVQNESLTIGHTTNTAIGNSSFSTNHQSTIGETGYTTSDTNNISILGFESTENIGVTSDGIYINEGMTCCGHVYAFDCTCCTLCNSCNSFDCSVIIPICEQTGNILCNILGIIGNILDCLTCNF